MRVLLIYAELPDTYRSFKHGLAFERKSSAFLLPGLLTTSAKAWPEFLHRFELGIPSKNYSSYKKNDLTLTPVPDFHLVKSDIDSTIPLVEAGSYFRSEIDAGLWLLKTERRYWS